MDIPGPEHDHTAEWRHEFEALWAVQSAVG
jgi:hypothetical protein